MTLFRDVYKAANDDIKADPELLRQIWSAAEQRKHTAFPYARQLVCGAAVAAVLFVTVWFTYPYLIPETALPPVAVERQTTSPADTAADVQAQPEPSEPAEDDQAPAAQQGDLELPAPPSEAAKAVEQPQPTGFENAAAAGAEPQSELPPELPSEPQAGSDPAVSSGAALHADVNARAVDEAAAQDLQAAESTADTAGAAGGGSGGGSSGSSSGGMLAAAAPAADMATAESAAASTDTWTLEQYYTYLGCRVAEQLAVPADLPFQGDLPAAIEIDPQTGEPYNDWWGFLFGSGRESVIVMTTKHTEEVLPYLENENYTHVEAGGSTAAVLWSGNYCEAYMVVGDIGFAVYAEQLTDEEVAALLESMAAIG